jgi:AcrR family transcriptional regulator
MTPEHPRSDSIAASRFPGLPGGLTAISPEIVDEIQRSRIADSLVSLMADHAYGTISVAQVLRHARMTPQTFAAVFDGKDDCLLAGYRIFAGRLAEELDAAWQRHAGWPDKVRASIASALAFAAEHPAVGRFLAVGVQEGGPEARAAHSDSLDRLASKLSEGRWRYAEAGPANRFADRVIVAGLVALVGDRLIAGQAARLPACEPELVELALALCLATGAAPGST